MHDQDEVLIRSVDVDLGRGLKGRVRWYGDLTDGAGPTPAETAIAKMILTVLHRHYPGHPWSLEVNGPQGFAKIGIIELLGPNWGMVLHLDSWTEHQVMDLAGQLLERFKIARSVIDVAHYLSAAAKIPLLGRFRARDAKRIPV